VVDAHEPVPHYEPAIRVLLLVAGLGDEVAGQRMDEAEAEEHEEPEGVGREQVLEALPGPGLVTGQAQP